MSTNERGILSRLEARTLRGRLAYWLMLAVLLLIGLGFVFPFFFSFTAGLKSNTEIFKPGLNLLPQSAQWQNYQDAWERFNILRMFKNSMLIAGGGVILQLLVSSLAAYSLARLNPIGGKVIMSILLMTLAIPGIAYLVPLYITLVDLPILNINLINSFWGLWLPYAANAFAIVMLKHFFEQIPRDIYDAAAVDGASALQTFFKITLPLSRSILLVLAMLSFVGLWKDFLLPQLVLLEGDLQPITVRLHTLSERFPKNLQMAAAFVAMIPPLLTAIVLQRYMKGGLTAGAVKG